jgi:hypothetical protein
MKYEDGEPKAQKGNSPHPAAKENITYYHKMIGKVRFTEDIKVEVQQDRDEWLSVLFVHGFPTRNGAYCISFHQGHREFRSELCGILNTMGYKGQLKRIDLPSEWEREFKKYG